MQGTEEYREKLHFILEALPLLNRCSRMTKDRVCRSFRPQNFPSGAVLFNEGQFIKQGFLLRTGEVEIYSRRNLKLINHISELKEESDAD